MVLPIRRACDGPETLWPLGIQKLQTETVNYSFDAGLVFDAKAKF